MNTYFAFWEKHETNGKPSNLEGRSLQASDVSACNGELNFWREAGSMAKENLVFSVPLANLVDFHIVKPVEVIETKEAEPPKIDCGFVAWTKEDPLPLSMFAKSISEARRIYEINSKLTGGCTEDKKEFAKLEELKSILLSINLFISKEKDQDLLILADEIFKSVTKTSFDLLQTWLSCNKLLVSNSSNLEVIAFADWCQSPQVGYRSFTSKETLLSYLVHDLDTLRKKRQEVLSSLGLASSDLDIVHNATWHKEKQIIFDFLCAVCGTSAKEDIHQKETSIYLQKHEKARRKIHPTIASFVKSVFPDKSRENNDEPLTEGEKARALSIQSQLREARPDGERMVWP